MCPRLLRHPVQPVYSYSHCYCGGAFKGLVQGFIKGVPGTQGLLRRRFNWTALREENFQKVSVNAKSFLSTLALRTKLRQKNSNLQVMSTS